MVQWTSTAGHAGSIPGQGTKIPHAAGHRKTKGKKQIRRPEHGKDGSWDGEEHGHMGTDGGWGETRGVGRLQCETAKPYCTGSCEQINTKNLEGGVRFRKPAACSQEIQREDRTNV